MKPLSIKHITMLKNKLLIAISLLCSIVFTGCELNEADGDWDPIKITVNGHECKSIYKVPTDGGVFKINSKNYGSLWLNDVKENGEIIWPKNSDWSDYMNIHLTTDWYEVQYDEAGNIVVAIQPKGKDAQSRNLRFDVECGDAFSSITLQQE